MDLLIVGANGLLGSNVAVAGEKHFSTVAGTYHSTRPDLEIATEQFDLADPPPFEKLLIKYDPDVVLNCAAMTDVDSCERNPGRAHLINARAPGTLAAACADHGTRFVHISTDYVFDGTTDDRYREDDEPNPIQAYGRSKLAGERTVRALGDDLLIVRLSFVYGFHIGTGSLTGFPAWVRERISDGESVPLFTDQWVTPSRVGQAAETILQLVDNGATGLYNAAARSCVTPFEFGSVLTNHLGGSHLLVEASLNDIDRAADRPVHTCLDISAVESELGCQQPTLEEDVEALAENL